MALIRLYRLGLLVTICAPLEGGLAEAVKYLEDEVPRWYAENRCYSCHNNGDGARALIAAQRAGWKVDRAALAPTLEYLAKPGEWTDDKPLARVQWAVALVSAREAGLVKDAGSVAAAAKLVALHQAGDGRVKVDEEKVEGSPCTYGPVVATWLSLKVFRAAGMTAEARRAEAYLASAPAWAVDTVLAAQAPNGSWGGEPYDTALAMLRLLEEGRNAAAVLKGREYLLKTQLSAGGWAATTRPSGGHSYAQHISTSAWCLLAMVESERPTRSEGAK